MSIRFGNRDLEKVAVSKALAAKALGISVMPLDVLVSAGYLPDLDINRIANIRSCQAVMSDGRYPVLRASRSNIAGLAQMDSKEQFRYLATGIANSSSEAVLEAGLIPVTLSRYVIAVLSVAGHTTDSDGKTDYIGTVAAKLTSLGDPDSVWVSDRLSLSDAMFARAMLGCLVRGDSAFQYGYLPEGAQ